MNTPIENFKIPPHSIEAEQSVLGGLLLDNRAWEQIADRISEEDFYRQDHRLIFRSIFTLSEQCIPLDVVTLSDWLQQRGELNNAGGLSYLGMLAKDTPSAANIRSYADIVREKSILRQLIKVGTDISELAFNPQGQDSKTILDQAEQAVFAIAERGINREKNFKPLKSLLKATLHKIEELGKLEGNITGLETGYPELDEMTSGLQKGDLIIVAGRPSMGKTTFAMNLAEFIATNSKLATAIFSLEMPAEQLTMRMLSSMGRINQTRLRTGQLNDNDWPRVASAVQIFSDVPLFIDETAGLSVGELKARSRRLAREQNGLGLIVIDYLQLMSGSGKADNRTNEVSEMSRSLKALAKELNVPIIVLSQLNRSLEQRADKRPIMSDLRESGAIEQDADIIMFVYRDAVYSNDPDEEKDNTAEIIIAKQRNGPIGTVRLTFLGKYTRFENYTPDVYH